MIYIYAIQTTRNVALEQPVSILNAEIRHARYNCVLNQRLVFPLKRQTRKIYWFQQVCIWDPCTKG